MTADPLPGWGARAVLVALRVYKLLFSPLYSGSCRFVPSCSTYAADAVRLHGALEGSALALARLVRCQPFCRPGYDPVPPVCRRHSTGQRSR